MKQTAASFCRQAGRNSRDAVSEGTPPGRGGRINLWISFPPACGIRDATPLKHMPTCLGRSPTGFSIGKNRPMCSLTGSGRIADNSATTTNCYNRRVERQRGSGSMKPGKLFGWGVLTLVGIGILWGGLVLIGVLPSPGADISGPLLVLNDVDGAGFEVIYTNSDRLAKEEWVNVYVYDSGSRSNWLGRLIHRRTLLFSYDPGYPAEKPHIEAAGPRKIRVSISHVSSVIYQSRPGFVVRMNASRLVVPAPAEPDIHLLPQAVMAIAED